MSDSVELVYVHDPMCSWCWGFRPTLERLCSQLPQAIRFRRLLGGLAADTDEPMPRAMQTQLQSTWQRIEQHIPGTRFNHKFWESCQPRRSTYPACRAVIAARLLSPEKEDDMILAIQQAYYLRAKNPSDTETLVQLAGELALDQDKFAFLLSRDFIDQQLQIEIGEARAMQATSFPTLVLKNGFSNHHTIPLDYTHAQPMLDTIKTLIAELPVNSAT